MSFIGWESRAIMLDEAVSKSLIFRIVFDSTGATPPNRATSLHANLINLPIQLEQVAQPLREAAGHGWRRRAGCLSLADRR
jgi:hypothetical protein